MNIKIKNMLLLNIILINIIGCDKDKDIIDKKPDTLTSIDTSYIVEFPNTIGNKWTYLYYDSTNQISDTVTISIIADTTLPNGESAKIWHFTYTILKNTNYIKDMPDTFYVSTTTDTIKFYNVIHSSLNLIEIYVFPLYVGKKWNRSFIDAKDSVISVNKIYFQGDSVLAYDIYRKIEGFNYYLHENIRYAPNVGIIRRNTKEYPNRTQMWQLINYN